MEITAQQYARIEPHLPVQRGNVFARESQRDQRDPLFIAFIYGLIVEALRQ